MLSSSRAIKRLRKWAPSAYRQPCMLHFFPASLSQPYFTSSNCVVTEGEKQVIDQLELTHLNRSCANKTTKKIRVLHRRLYSYHNQVQVWSPFSIQFFWASCKLKYTVKVYQHFTEKFTENVSVMVKALLITDPIRWYISAFASALPSHKNSSVYYWQCL